jgi:secreted trypsin-like serine protease
MAALGLAFFAASRADAAQPGVGPAGAEVSVVGGSSASIASFPWLAHIVYEGPVDSFECTGTVVAPRLVLTAGHCGVSETGHLLDPSKYVVVTGSADLKQTTAANISHAAQVIINPGYEPAKNLRDAALLVLTAPVSAPAIPLADAGEGPPSGGTGIAIAGWGLTSGDSRKAPTVLRFGETVVQDAAYCNEKARKVTPFYDSASQFCAIAAPTFEVGPCHGDSGGPGIGLRADGTPVQVGIISMAAPDCRTNIPGIETRVDQIAPWVSSWIAAVEAGGPAPPIVAPPLLQLPRLTFKAAAFFAYVGLASDFRNRFEKGRFKDIACRRMDRERIKCGVFWYLAGSVYSGTVTVYYSLPQEGSFWNLSYRIRKVNGSCWLDTENARRCPGVLFHR